MCRQTQVLHLRVENKKQVTHKVVQVTTGLAQLPWDGGLLDQPWRLMEFFQLFRQGDSIASQKQLSSS